MTREKSDLGSILNSPHGPSIGLKGHSYLTPSFHIKCIYCKTLWCLQLLSLTLLCLIRGYQIAIFLNSSFPVELKYPPWLFSYCTKCQKRPKTFIFLVIFYKIRPIALYYDSPFCWFFSGVPTPPAYSTPTIRHERVRMTVFCGAF